MGTVSLCLSLSLYVSLCLSRGLSVSLCLSLSLSLSLSVSLCLSLSLSVSLCLSLSPSLSLRKKGRKKGIGVWDNPKQRVLCKQKPVPHPLPPFPFSHHGQASCSAACPWVRKGERGKGMGQCCGCPHNGQPRQLSMKAKFCAASKHCFVRNHCLSESPVTTFGWWCVVVCARGLSLSLCLSVSLCLSLSLSVSLCLSLSLSVSLSLSLSLSL